MALAIRGDAELDGLFPTHRKGIVGGGVMPHVHKSALTSQAIDDANLDGLTMSALVRLAGGAQPASTSIGPFWVLACAIWPCSRLRLSFDAFGDVQRNWSRMRSIRL